MNRQTWFQLTLVQAGGAICLPIFVIGNLLGEKYGFHSAIIAIALGNFILFGLGALAAYASGRDRKSTASYAVEIFGFIGKGFFSLAMSLAMMGWFAIQLNLMGEGILSVLPFSVPLIVVNLVLGLLITLVSFKGIKGLNDLSNLSMPILLLTIGYGIYSVRETPPMENNQPLSLGGISLVLAAAIGAVVDLPTFFREARTSRDGIIASCLLFLFVIPCLEGIGVYLSFHSEGGSLLKVLTSAGNSPIWSLWVAFFLVLAGWTTNQANLYSASVSLESLFPSLNAFFRLAFLGLFGTLLSLINIEENLSIVLEGIGVVLSSMGAVLSLHYLFAKKISSQMNCIIFIGGMIVGIVGFIEIPVLDGYLGAFILGLIIKLRLRNETNYCTGS